MRGRDRKGIQAFKLPVPVVCKAWISPALLTIMGGTNPAFFKAC